MRPLQVEAQIDLRAWRRTNVRAHARGYLMARHRREHQRVRAKRLDDLNHRWHIDLTSQRRRALRDIDILGTNAENEITSRRGYLIRQGYDQAIFRQPQLVGSATLCGIKLM